MRLEPRTPGLRVKHFTTEPRGTLQIESIIYADDKITMTEKLTFFFGGGRVENIVGIGENAGYQHFLLFPQCFQKVSCTGVLKGRGLFGKELSNMYKRKIPSLLLKVFWWTLSWHWVRTTSGFTYEHPDQPSHLLLLRNFNDCMMFNAIFNSISAISRQTVHLSMFSWSSFNQYSA